uniref:IF rod domain-containing protein n=1 Tax=Sphaeramia orbicularis TaxID=375764 RepID=A0A672Z2A7_9TELE
MEDGALEPKGKWFSEQRPEAGPQSPAHHPLVFKRRTGLIRSSGSAVDPNLIMGSKQSSTYSATYGGNTIYGDGNISIVNHGSSFNLRLRRSAGFCPPSDEKLSVQTLDTCLLDYLSTVRSLEDTNAQLELKIRQWVESSGDSASRDYSTCFQTMFSIRSKVKGDGSTNPGNQT